MLPALLIAWRHYGKKICNETIGVVRKREGVVWGRQSGGQREENEWNNKWKKRFLCLLSVTTNP